MSNNDRVKLIPYGNAHHSATSRVWNGDAVWVEIADGGARHGSIGLLSPVGFKPQEPKTYPPLLRVEAVYGADKFDIHFPGKKPITVRVKSKNLFVLVDYKGQAVFKYKSQPRPKQDKFEPKDITGYPISVNNMVVFTTPQLGTLQYGTVERISDSGLTVYIKRIDIVNAKYVEGTRWDKDLVQVASSTNIGDNRSDRITVIRSDLLTDLMRVKLSL